MTTPFRTIGCCIDHSPAGRIVAAEGARLRDAAGAGSLSLVHVVEPPPALRAGPYTYVEPAAVVRSDESHWLHERVERTPGATGVLLEGDPAREVCAWASRAGADLLIVARHRGPIARVLHGSFASRVAENAPCPVLVLRPPA